MVRVAVQPVRSHHGPGKGVELLAAEAVDAASAASASSIYIIQPVEKLPTINTTRTVAGVLVGRKRAQLADKWVVHLALRYRTWWHAMGVVFTFACASLCIIDDPVARYAVTVVSTALMGPILWVHTAALCWDLLALLVHTFEFWFLIFINSIDNVIWNFMFHDVRIVANVMAGGSCLLTVFLDANLHMRVLVLRLFVPGALVLLFMTAIVNLHIASDADYSSIDIWGAEMKTIDVMNSGMFTICFFMVTRVFRYRSVIFSCHQDDTATTSDAMVTCDIYFPVCRLVRYEEWNRQRRTSVSQSPRMVRRLADMTQLQLVERDQLRIIDARDTIASLQWCQLGPYLATCPRVSHLLQWILNTIGIGGCGLAVYLCGTEVVSAQSTTATPGDMLVSWHLAAYLSTALFVLTHAAFFQRELVRRICLEIDAWFVSFQASVVAVAACDIFNWDRRGSLVAIAWFWCHWMLFLDALPPVMRRRLALSRAFIVLVSFLLLVFPLWLGYMMVYAPNAATMNRNRIIFETKVAQVHVRMEMLSFLLSRIFTLWVWMGRFFWREVLRPRDSFKLIKYRVQFPRS